MADSHHLENSNIVITPLRFYRLWWNLTWWRPLILFNMLNFWVLTNSVLNGHHFEKWKSSLTWIHNDKYGQNVQSTEVSNKTAVSEMTEPINYLLIFTRWHLQSQKIPHVWNCSSSSRECATIVLDESSLVFFSFNCFVKTEGLLVGVGIHCESGMSWKLCVIANIANTGKKWYTAYQIPIVTIALSHSLSLLEVHLPIATLQAFSNVFVWHRTLRGPSVMVVVPVWMIMSRDSLSLFSLLL